MNKKIVSLLLFTAVFGQLAQAGLEQIKTAAKKLGHFALDVKHIVTPEWPIKDKMTYGPYGRLAQNEKGEPTKWEDVSHEERWPGTAQADSKKIYYKQDAIDRVFEVKEVCPRLNVGKHSIARFIKKIITADSQKNEKINTMHFDCTRGAYQHELDHKLLFMGPRSLVFWIAITAGIGFVAKKIHDKIIKKNTQALIEDLGEDNEVSEENLDQKIATVTA